MRVLARTARWSRRVYGDSVWGDGRHVWVVISPLLGGCQGANPGAGR